MKIKNFPLIRTGIGQDSHRFLPEDSTKPCVIAGLVFDDTPGFRANSDGDVVFHALCNAISSVSGIVILGALADDLFKKKGITDSRVFVEEALKTLKNQEIIHAAFTLEAKRPLFLKRIPEMQRNVAELLNVDSDQVGMTATSGEGLTDFGCGDGVQCFCIITVADRQAIFSGR